MLPAVDEVDCDIGEEHHDAERRAGPAGMRKIAKLMKETISIGKMVPLKCVPAALSISNSYTKIGNGSGQQL